MHRAMKVWIAQNLERCGSITPNHVFHVSALGKEYAVRRDDLGANLGPDPSHDSRGLITHNTSILMRRENLVKKVCISRRPCDGVSRVDQDLRQVR